ncbi:MAG: DUF945 family protein [Idiomarina sp.]|nr:DUF945 family protein [Idiomarina sp.]
MARLIKWLVGLVVIAGIIYLGLVAVTGSQMRSIAEDQLETYNAQSPEAEVNISWHETGFWRSVGEVRLVTPMEGETLDVVHSIELRHGALRAGISGEVTGLLGDVALNDMLFADQPIRLDGRIGLGGVRLTYAVPALNFTHYLDEDLGERYTAAPFEIDVVLREHEQHTQFEIEWIEMRSAEDGATDTMRFENLAGTSQSRLNKDDRQFDHAQTSFSVGQVVFGLPAQGQSNDVTIRIDGFHNETEMTRDNGDVEIHNRLTVDAYDVYGVEGELTAIMQMGPVPYTSFQALQEDIEDPAVFNAFLHDLQQHDSRLVIETLDLTMGQMGDLRASGEFWLRNDIDFNQGFTAAAAGDFLAGRMEIEDLPLLILMPLSGMISGELPWTLELNEGDLLINGEPLNLPQM